jgi:hypothetical protein
MNDQNGSEVRRKRHGSSTDLRKILEKGVLMVAVLNRIVDNQLYNR